MKGKIFAVFVIFAVVLMGFATICVEAAKNVMLRTDMFQYDVGESVTFTVKNIGDTFTYHHWKVTIWNAETDEVVYLKSEDPDGPYKLVIHKLAQGDEVTWTWDQKYYIVRYEATAHIDEPTGQTTVTWERVYDRRNGQQVPEGWYKAEVTFCEPDGKVIVSSDKVVFYIGNIGNAFTIEGLEIPQL